MAIIPLNIPSGRHDAFVHNLNASLWASLESSHSSASFQADGSFSTWTTGPAIVAGRRCALTFRLLYGPANDLQSCEVECDDSGDNADWLPFCKGLITEALVRALSERTERYFFRSQMIYIGEALDGEYWLDGGRIAPAVPDDKDPYLMNAERVLYWEFHVHAVDQHHAHALAQERTRLSMTRFSFLLETPLTCPESVLRWVVPVGSDGSRLESVRLQVGFWSASRPIAMPKKGVVCRLGRYAGSIADRFRRRGAELRTMPIEARRIIRALRDGPARFREAFDACARLWSLSLQIARHSRTAALAYRVAAVDAVAQTVGGNGGVKDFFRAHVGNMENVDGLVDVLYGNVRSAHFHAGAAGLDVDHVIPFHPLMCSASVSQWQLLDQGHYATRLCIATWIEAECRRITQERNNSQEDEPSAAEQGEAADDRPQAGDHG